MDELTRGERAAERVASGLGSWRFISIQNTLIACWMALNVVAWVAHWDPYPFILLNLAMSWQAANATPILQMTGNAAAKRDRALWQMMSRILRHVERVAQADHTEHGKLLREIHAHIHCEGHTHVGGPAAGPAEPVAARRHTKRDGRGRFVKAEEAA